MAVESSGEITVSAATAVEVIRIQIHVVVIVVRHLIEESGPRTVVGAMVTRADIIDTGVACKVAIGLIRTPRLAAIAAAKTGGVAEAALMTAAHHRTNAAHQQTAADHAGCRRRGGSEKRAAAADRSLRRAIGLTVRRLIGLPR